MSQRHIHYEAAFEDFLRSRGVPYVPVNETRRVIFAGAKIKSFDFIVYPSDGEHWIVDVKGRRFPYVSSTGARRYWENWVTREDIGSLEEWQTVFGEDFEARFVFAYLLDGPPDRWPAVRPHAFREDYYAFLSVTLTDYQRCARRRSDKWDTVGASTAAFRQIVRSLESLGSSRAQKQQTDRSAKPSRAPQP